MPPSVLTNRRESQLYDIAQLISGWALIAGRTGVAAGSREGFSDLLRAVQAERSAPREVVDVLHRLRRFGNDAAHGAGGKRRDALEAIKFCRRLGV